MAGAPWYLLAVGIGVLILGVLLANLRGPGRDQTHLHAKMSDKEIARRLARKEGDLLSSLVIFAGLLMIGASVLWRLARFFIRI